MDRQEAQRLMAHVKSTSESTIAQHSYRSTSGRSGTAMPVSRLEDLRTEIQQGTYYVPLVQLAEALMQLILETDTSVN